MRRFGPELDGTQVTVRPGDDFEIALAENASTGYQWAVVAVPEGVHGVSDRTVLATRQPGAGGQHRFRFRADEGAKDGAGGRITLHLRRVWERDKPPYETFDLDVRVSLS